MKESRWLVATVLGLFMGVPAIADEVQLSCKYRNLNWPKDDPNYAVIAQPKHYTLTVEGDEVRLVQHSTPDSTFHFETVEVTPLRYTFRSIDFAPKTTLWLDRSSLEMEEYRESLIGGAGVTRALQCEIATPKI